MKLFDCKYMILTLLCTGMAAFMGCSKEEGEPEEPLGGIKLNHICINILNKDGVDLLDENNEGFLLNKNISFYWNGKQIPKKESDDWCNAYYIENPNPSKNIHFIHITTRKAWMECDELVCRRLKGHIFIQGQEVITPGAEKEFVIDWGDNDRDTLYIRVIENDIHPGGNHRTIISDKKGQTIMSGEYMPSSWDSGLGYIKK